jgi:hypothetical protein
MTIPKEAGKTEVFSGKLKVVDPFGLVPEEVNLKEF